MIYRHSFYNSSSSTVVRVPRSTLLGKTILPSLSKIPPELRMFWIDFLVFRIDGRADAPTS